MMRRHLGAAILLLAACSAEPAQRGDAEWERQGQLHRSLEESIRTHPLPGAVLVDRIENQLQRDPCIGSLERWYRRYSYGLDHERGIVDPNTVWFTFHEAGAHGFRAGRAIQRPWEEDHLDHRPYLVALGSYDVADDRAAIDVCGPNQDLEASVRPGSSIANMLAGQR